MWITYAIGICTLFFMQSIMTMDMHDAAYQGDHETLIYLIDQGTDVNAVRTEKTPLHVACRRGHLDIVRTLIEHGADVNAGDTFGSPPIEIASQKEHLEIMAMLIHNQADVNARDHFHNTPLHAAVTAGHINAVKMLIECGACVHPKDYLPQEKTLSDYVPQAIASCINTVRSYLTKTRESDIYHVVTPLHRAAFFSYPEITRLLIEEEAPQDIPDPHGQSPVDIAEGDCQMILQDMMPAIYTGNSLQLKKIFADRSPQEKLRYARMACICKRPSLAQAITQTIVDVDALIEISPRSCSDTTWLTRLKHTAQEHGIDHKDMLYIICSYIQSYRNNHNMMHAVAQYRNEHNETILDEMARACIPHALCATISALMQYTDDKSRQAIMQRPYDIIKRQLEQKDRLRSARQFHEAYATARFKMRMWQKATYISLTHAYRT